MDLLKRRSLLVLLPLGMLAPAWWLLLREDRPARPEASTPSSSKGPVREIPDPMLLVRRDPAPAEGEAVLKRIRAKWRAEEELYQRLLAEGRGGRCGTQPPGQFTRDYCNDQIELRLFCLGYPDVAMKWAHDATFSQATPGWERHRTIRMLGYLASVRIDGAAADLARLARESEDFDTVEIACWQLSLAPQAGENRALFKALAREGSSEAMAALAYREDAESTAIAREGLTKWPNQPYPKGAFHYIAEEVLPRFESLAAGTWKSRAFNAISTEPGPYCRVDIAWALELCRQQRPDGFGKLLRERLTKIYAQGGSMIASDHPEVPCDAFDSVLLTLGRIGGDLLPKEIAYLARHGYGVDPRRRLTEILAEKHYPQ